MGRKKEVGASSPKGTVGKCTYGQGEWHVVHQGWSAECFLPELRSVCIWGQGTPYPSDPHFTDCEAGIETAAEVDTLPIQFHE